MAWRMLTAAVVLLLEPQTLPGIMKLLGAVPWQGLGELMLLVCGDTAQCFHE